MAESSLGSQWETLPYPVLVEMFHHLNNPDRLKAAQVCKHWYDAFHCPDLWRCLRLDLTANLTDPTVKVEQAFEFVKRHGAALRHLEINCELVEKYPYQNLLRDNVPKFLKMIAVKSQLNRFIMSGVGCFQLPADIVSHLLDSLVALLASQESLEVLDLVHSVMKMEDGVRILHAASLCNGPNIKELRLNCFFKEPEFRDNSFPDVLAKFTSLYLLSIDYNYLTEETIAAVADNGTLHILEVDCSGEMPHCIPRSCWRRLESRCPAVRVQVTTGPFEKPTNLVNFLSPTIPLYLLNYYPTYMYDDYVGEESLSGINLRRETDIINYIADTFSSTLEEVNLFYYENCPVPSPALKNLALSCKRLKKINLAGFVPFQLFSVLLELISDTEAALSKLQLTVMELAEPEDVDASVVFRTYTDLLKSMHVEYTLSSTHSYLYLKLNLYWNKNP